MDKVRKPSNSVFVGGFQILKIKYLYVQSQRLIFCRYVCYNQELILVAFIRKT
jgi:hypothetical protein